MGRFFRFYFNLIRCEMMLLTADLADERRVGGREGVGRGMFVRGMGAGIQGRLFTGENGGRFY
jgi:hypothetical protein